MRAEMLLTDVINDLENLLETADEYSILRASGLLRLMLLDRDPLLVQVAKSHQVPLTFTVSAAPLPGGEAYGDGITIIYPSLTPSWATATTTSGGIDLTLDQFLAHPAMRVVFQNDHLEFSAKTVIRVAAIAFGGVHFMNPDRAEDRELAALARRLDPASGRGIAIAVGTLGHVVLGSCGPLVERLNAYRS